MKMGDGRYDDRCAVAMHPSIIGSDYQLKWDHKLALKLVGWVVVVTVPADSFVKSVRSANPRFRFQLKRTRPRH